MPSGQLTWVPMLQQPARLYHNSWHKPSTQRSEVLKQIPQGPVLSGVTLASVTHWCYARDSPLEEDGIKGHRTTAS
jgi:hypothetical protein